MNRDEHDEECNSHTEDHDCREEDHQEDNFREIHPQELRNRRPTLMETDERMQEI
jgi:hypothetical protein